MSAIATLPMEPRFHKDPPWPGNLLGHAGTMAALAKRSAAEKHFLFWARHKARGRRPERGRSAFCRRAQNEKIYLQPDGKGMAAANSELKFLSLQSEDPGPFPSTGAAEMSRKDGQT